MYGVVISYVSFSACMFMYLFSFLLHAKRYGVLNIARWRSKRASVFSFLVHLYLPFLTMTLYENALVTTVFCDNKKSIVA